MPNSRGVVISYDWNTDEWKKAGYRTISFHFLKIVWPIRENSNAH